MWRGARGVGMRGGGGARSPSSMMMRSCASTAAAGLAAVLAVAPLRGAGWAPVNAPGGGGECHDDNGLLCGWACLQGTAAASLQACQDLCLSFPFAATGLCLSVTYYSTGCILNQNDNDPLTWD
eukprot:gene9243-4278_t